MSLHTDAKMVPAVGMDQGVTKHTARQLFLAAFVLLGAITASFLILSVAPAPSFWMPPEVQPIIVNWSSPKQTIDGFGAAAFTWHSGLTPTLADFFFTTNGIGLSIVRVGVIPNLSDCMAYGAINHPPFSCAPSLGAVGATMALGDLQLAQEAYTRGAIVMATSWSPPGTIKSNGSYLTGGPLVGNGANYQSYASQLATVPAFLAANGIPSLYALSPQNEPDLSVPYPSCTWTAQQFHDFVPYLYTALAGSTQIMITEESTWDFSLAATAMNDPAVAADVGILAAHGYRVNSPYAPTNYGKHVWQSEDADIVNSYDGSMSNALTWAQIIHNYLSNANVNAWTWWYVSDMPNNGNGTDNSALTDYSGNIPMRAYMTGNWSKFVRPGWHRVDVTNSGALLVTAFAGPLAYHTAIVAINLSSSAVSNQQFSVGTEMGDAVIPWITSATYSLQAQFPVAVSAGSFTYTLPAQSVVTFYGSVVTPPLTSSQNPSSLRRRSARRNNPLDP